MSNPDPKAVFLSYASQDAEAVRRIAEALRAAGVEVWFDQNELVGGDAWDAKIRKQIAECALFVPIISANTQARLEGYFRIEWKLAARRTHAMATAKAFLLPIVIDATRDAEAHVPDEFREVQWTRLPGAEAPEKFCARVKTLLGGEGRDASLPRQARDAEHVERARRPSSDAGESPGRLGETSLPQKPARRVRAPAWIAAVAIVVAVALYFALRPAAPPAGAGTRPPAAEKSAAPMSEARALLPKIWALLNKPELARAELDAADALCKQAVTLDQADADIWAAWSYADVWFVWYGFDSTPTRQESARDKSARAMRLAPKSYEARLAHANYLVRCVWQKETATTTAGEAEPMLRDLLRERPDEPRVLYLQGMFVFLKDNLSEDKSALERMEKNPSFAVAASKEIGWQHYWAGRWAKADEAADRSIALQPYWDNLGLKIQLARRWHGDLTLAKTTLNRLPPSALREVGSEGIAWGVLWWRRDADEMLAFLGSIPREWVTTGQVITPKSFLAGQARLRARQPEVARREFRRALDLIEPRLAVEPNNAELLGIKATALFYLDDRAEAERNYRLSVAITPPSIDLLALFESPENAIAELEARARKGVDFFSQWFVDLTAASLRLNPAYDPLRNHPAFAALLATAESDPLRSPKAKVAASAPVTAQADEKSVAVLAFANLSDDKANEYFSDGISEELLNVLAKVPGLTVRGRSSGFYFKGRQFKSAEIGRQLNVSHLVQGSVRRAGDRVRISAQLIRAATDEVVWSSGSLERDLKDIFAVQDEIAGLIAKNLSVSMGVAARTPHQVNPEALTALLEGRHFWVLRTPEGFARARNLFNRAVALDPNWAPARAALANLLTIEASFLKGGGAEFSELMAAGAREARRAIELDATLGEPHAALGKIAMEERRLVEAEEEFRRALALEPNNALVRDWYADLAVIQGRLDVAIAEYRRALELEPLAPYILWDLAWELMHVRRFAEALALVERAAALTPTGAARLSLRRARLLLELGRPAETEARAALQTYLEGKRTGSDPQFANEAVYCLRALSSPAERDRWTAELLRLYPDSFASGVIFLMLGQTEKAYPLLEKTPAIFWQQLYWDPVFDAARPTTRFQQLLEKLGCAEEYKVARVTHARLLRENGTGK